MATIRKATTLQLRRITELLLEAREEKPITLKEIKLRLGIMKYDVLDALQYLFDTNQLRRREKDRVYYYYVPTNNSPQLLKIKKIEKNMEKEGIELK